MEPASSLPPAEPGGVVALALAAPRRLRLVADGDLPRLRLEAAIGLIVMNIADLAVTRLALASGASEANALMAPLVTSNWGWVVKIGIPLGVALLHLSRPVQRRHVLALCWVTTFYLYVVTWNVSILLR